MSDKITGANDITITLKEADGGDSIGATASLVVDDFEFTESQDKPLQHGIGNEEPVGRVYGNKEYTLSFTLNGEDAAVYNAVAGDDTLMDIVATGNEYKWNIKDLSATEYSYSASDGSDPVEFAVDLNALSVVQEEV